MSKQDALEQAARRYAGVHPTIDIDEEERYYNSNCKYYDAFIDGAAWQAERMYSEEEVLEILYEWSMYKVNIELDKLADELSDILSYDEWFKQNKKK